MSEQVQAEWQENTDQNPFWMHRGGPIEIEYENGTTRVIECPSCYRPSHRFIKRWRAVARRKVHR